MKDIRRYVFSVEEYNTELEGTWKKIRQTSSPSDKDVLYLFKLLLIPKIKTKTKKKASPVSSLLIGIVWGIVITALALMMLSGCTPEQTVIRSSVSHPSHIEFFTVLLMILALLGITILLGIVVAWLKRRVCS